jgi:hypothetical protein
MPFLPKAAAWKKDTFKKVPFIGISGSPTWTRTRDLRINRASFDTHRRHCNSTGRNYTPDGAPQQTELGGPETSMSNHEWLESAR